MISRSPARGTHSPADSQVPPLDQQQSEDIQDLGVGWAPWRASPTAHDAPLVRPSAVWTGWRYPSISDRRPSTRGDLMAAMTAGLDAADRSRRKRLLLPPTRFWRALCLAA